METKDGRIVEDRALGIYPNSEYALYTFIIRHWLQYGFKFKQSTLKLQLSNKLIIVGAKNGGKITTRLYTSKFVLISYRIGCSPAKIKLKL